MMTVKWSNEDMAKLVDLTQANSDMKMSALTEEYNKVADVQRTETAVRLKLRQMRTTSLYDSFLKEEETPAAEVKVEEPVAPAEVLTEKASTVDIETLEKEDEIYSKEEEEDLEPIKKPSIMKRIFNWLFS